jgi:hypothetical protein
VMSEMIFDVIRIIIDYTGDIMVKLDPSCQYDRSWDEYHDIQYIYEVLKSFNDVWHFTDDLHGETIKILQRRLDLLLQILLGDLPLKDLFQAIQADKGVISGGILLEVAHPKKSANDIDIFLPAGSTNTLRLLQNSPHRYCLNRSGRYSPEDIEDIRRKGMQPDRKGKPYFTISELEDDMKKENLPIRRRTRDKVLEVYNFNFYITVQLVFVDMKLSVTEFIERSFDFDFLKNYYDGRKLIITNIASYFNPIIRITKNIWCCDRNMIARISKYHELCRRVEVSNKDLLPKGIDPNEPQKECCSDESLYRKLKPLLRRYNIQKNFTICINGSNESSGLQNYMIKMPHLDIMEYIDLTRINFDVAR